MEFQYNYDRMLVIGRSGSGKTFFVSQLLKHVPNYLVLTQKSNDYYPKNHIILLNYDIENIIITKNKKNKIMGIDLRVIPVYLKVQLISADNNEQEYEKFVKLLNDLKELLK